MRVGRQLLGCRKAQVERCLLVLQDVGKKRNWIATRWFERSNRFAPRDSFFVQRSCLAPASLTPLLQAIGPAQIDELAHGPLPLSPMTALVQEPDTDNLEQTGNGGRRAVRKVGLRDG